VSISALAVRSFTGRSSGLCEARTAARQRTLSGQDGGASQRLVFVEPFSCASWEAHVASIVPLGRHPYIRRKTFSSRCCNEGCSKHTTLKWQIG
jgi:hypothetical protein